MSSLFRPEVYEQKKYKLYGDVTIPGKLPYMLVSAVFLISFVFFLVLAILGEYHRVERAKGMLVPSRGLVKVIVPKQGIISELNVAPGSIVKKNDPLVVVGTSTFSSSNASVEQQSIVNIQRRIEIVTQQKALETARFESDLLVLQSEEQMLLRSLAAGHESVSLQREIVLSEEKTYEDSQLLRKNGHISSVELERRKKSHLAAQQRLGDLEQALASLQNSIDQNRINQQKRQLTLEDNLIGLEDQILNLRQEYALLISKEQYSLLAPVDGTVDAVIVNTGQAVGTSDMILSLLPIDGKLIAEIYVPSRSIGFLKQGQEAKLTFDAFPQEQFGAVSARIETISRSVLLPSDIKGEISNKEPMYRVIAAIPEGALELQASGLSFRAGMALEATILLEKTSLFGWIFNPIKRLTDRA